jgi:lipopolysaccharide export system permease protein
LIISIFYNFSSSLKKVYLELKSNYTIDGKYLAVVTKNGLWIKDKVDNKILIINASKIEENYLVDSFISEFDKNFNVIRNIYSEKINVNNKEWVVFNPKIFENNTSISKESIIIKSNFDYKRIQSLFSNLSSLSLMKILELKKNYKLLNYSTTEIDIQIQKIVSYPVYLVLMTIIATILMLNTKQFKSTTLKISIGLFFSVLIYFINNFFNVLGNTEKISVISSVWAPLIILSIINFLMVYRINEK